MIYRIKQVSSPATPTIKEKRMYFNLITGYISYGDGKSFYDMTDEVDFNLLTERLLS